MGGGRSKLCVVGREYCNKKGLEFAVVRKVQVTSPDQDNSIYVADSKQKYVFKIKDTTSAFGVLQKKRVLLDGNGNHILTLRQKVMTLHSKWRVYEGNNLRKKHLIFTAQKSAILGSNTDLKVFLKKNKTKTCDFRVVSGKVYVGDNITNSIAEMCDGALKVNPKADQAFIISLFVIMNGIITDQRWEIDVPTIMLKGTMFAIGSALGS